MYKKKKKNLKSSRILAMLHEKHQAGKAACGPKRNGQCAFFRDECWGKCCRRHAQRGEGKKRLQLSPYVQQA